MKPHFHPGDQVMTRAGRVGTVVSHSRSSTTGNWAQIVDTGLDRPEIIWERDLWHVNRTVAKERAYARKGRVIPSAHGEAQDHPPPDPQR